MAKKNQADGLIAILLIVGAIVFLAVIFLPVANTTYAESTTQEFNDTQGNNVTLTNTTVDGQEYKLKLELTTTYNASGVIFFSYRVVDELENFRSPTEQRIEAKGNCTESYAPRGNITVCLNDITQGSGAYAEFNTTHQKSYYLNNDAKTVLGIFGIMLIIGILVAVIPLVGDSL